MSQSQSVRLFLLNHWDQLFCNGFQIKNNRQRCFPMVVNNRSSDAIITMHRSSLECNMKFSWREWVKVTMEFNQVKGRSEGEMMAAVQNSCKTSFTLISICMHSKGGFESPLSFFGQCPKKQKTVEGMAFLILVITSILRRLYFKQNLFAPLPRHSWQDNPKFM